MTLKKIFGKLDLYILIPYIILCGFGIIMVYSSSANIAIQNGGNPFAYLVKQSIYVFLGIFLAMFVKKISMKFLRNSNVIMIIGLVLILSLVWVKIFGKAINGASGWISLGFFNVQPAEFAKIYIIMRLANVIDEKQEGMFTSFKEWRDKMTGALAFFAIIIVLIGIQPDIGGAAINVAIVIMMILASGIPFKRAIKILGSGSAFVLTLFIAVVIPVSQTDWGAKHYQIKRIVAFLDPFGHATSAGQQLVNSYYAISNGGLFGVGLGNSIQKTGYLPEPNTDFIMSIITEELGSLVTVFILGMLALIIIRTIHVGIKSGDKYQQLLCYGVATYFTIQALFNVGALVGLLPITGVTFPFVSYGGSSMLTLSIAIGLVLNVSRRSNNNQERKLVNQRRN